MTSFLEFLRARGPSEGFSTEDALACFLPLAKRVLRFTKAAKTLRSSELITLWLKMAN